MEPLVVLRCGVWLRQLRVRVRDIDGDGLREVTAIFNHVASGIYTDNSEECGAVAFLMSGDSRIQALPRRTPIEPRLLAR